MVIIKSRVTHDGFYYCFQILYKVPCNACTCSELISLPCLGMSLMVRSFIQSALSKRKFLQAQFDPGSSNSVIRAPPNYSNLFSICFPLGSFYSRLSTFSCKVTDSDSSHLNTFLQVTAAKVPKYDSNNVICPYLNQSQWPWECDILIGP